MSKTVIFLADGFEDVEAITPIDFLKRAGIDVTIAGVTGQHITSAHGVKIESEVCATTIKVAEFDALILPGGMPGATSLRDSETVIRAIQEFFKAGKLVTAICAAPMALDRAGVLEGKNYTMYPGMQQGLKTGNYLDEKVVEDKNVITAAGVAVAADFAFAIIKRLKGDQAVDDLKNATLFSRFA